MVCPVVIHEGGAEAAQCENVHMSSQSSPLPAAGVEGGGAHAGSPGQAPRWTPTEVSLLVGSVVLITLNAFEALATTTIMPNVVADLGAESWFSVASGAALTAQLAATVLAGALSDWRGARTVLLAGVASFACGLLLSALAPHVSVFVVGRIFQGIGAGLVIVPLYVFVGSVVHEPRRPIFFAAFSLAWVMPALVGPAIAGWVATYLGWRPVFGAVPALAVIALIPLVTVLRRIQDPPSRPAPNLLSLTLWALGGGCGVLALQLAGALAGWSLVALATAGGTMAAVALPRLLPHGIWTGRPGIPAMVLTRMLAMATNMGATAFIPLLLQRIHGWQADAASVAVTLGAVSWSLGSTVQSRVKDPMLRDRLPYIGVVLIAVGLVPTATLVTTWLPVWPAMVGWTVCGMGIGLMHSSLSVRALGMTPTSEHGKVSSWLQVADSAGAAIVMAMTSLVLAGAGAAGATGSALYFPAVLLCVVIALGTILSASRINGHA